MNYVWELIINNLNNKESRIEKKDVTFLPAEVSSPYMELSHDYINVKTAVGTVEINPYHRFYSIFKDFFNDKIKLDPVFENTLFDIIVHFLCNIDLRQGMSKHEYYKKFLLEELLSGQTFGEKVIGYLEHFSNKERDILLTNILKMYITGDMLNLLVDTIDRIFENTRFFSKDEKGHKLIFLMSYEKSEVYEEKMKLIKDIFLPVGLEIEIYWGNFFGIIEAEETMIIGSMLIY